MILESKIIMIDNDPTRYEIYEDGSIFSHISEMFLKPYPSPDGYLLIDISHNKKVYTRQVHRLVATAFIPNPDKIETVNHKDGDKTNNHVNNLEWMTRISNVRHAWETGLVKPRSGEDNPANKFTEEQIREVCKLLETNKYNYKVISRITGVSYDTVKDIKYKRAWVKVSKEYDIKDTRAFRYLKYKNYILKLLSEHKTNSEIYELLNHEVPIKHIGYLRNNG